MEQGKVHLFSDVASVNNGGNSLLGQRLDSLTLNPIFRNIILVIFISWQAVIGFHI